MIKRILMFAILAISITACKPRKEKMLVNTWQAIDLDNPQMDMMITEQRRFIDTFGSSGNAETNVKLYGTTNIDSYRQALTVQLAEFKKMQDESIKNTWFNFRKDGVAIMNFSGQLDSTNWYFEEDTVLILDEMKLKGTGNKIRMGVLKLDEKEMKLKFSEEGLVSTVTFKPKEK
jgi:hypothetical protein